MIDIKEFEYGIEHDIMQELARFVNKKIPDNWGFFVMVFPFCENLDDKPRANYVSNGKRGDILAMMKDFIERSGEMNLNERNRRY